jgi:hypothetical protein
MKGDIEICGRCKSPIEITILRHGLMFQCHCGMRFEDRETSRLV